MWMWLSSSWPFILLLHPSLVHFQLWNSNFMKLIRLCVRATGRAASAAKNVLKRLILESSKRINPSLWEVLYQMLMELSYLYRSITDRCFITEQETSYQNSVRLAEFYHTNVTKWGYFCIKLLSLFPASASYVEKWAIIPLMRAAGCSLKKERKKPWFYISCFANLGLRV